MLYLVISEIGPVVQAPVLWWAGLIVIIRLGPSSSLLLLIPPVCTRCKNMVPVSAHSLPYTHGKRLASIVRNREER